MAALNPHFYTQQDVVVLAKEFLGKYLMTEINGLVTGGMIIETEAYKGPEDRACHAYNYRRTKRTEVMFQKGGVAYVYLCYGMHNLFNIVTNVENIPHAILIRALAPKEGIEVMQKRRGIDTMNQLTSGPGKLCQALGIERKHNGYPLFESPLWIENRGVYIDPKKVISTPRIGVAYAKEDAKLPYRFVYLTGENP